MRGSREVPLHLHHCACDRWRNPYPDEGFFPLSVFPCGRSAFALTLTTGRGETFLPRRAHRLRRSRGWGGGCVARRSALRPRPRIVNYQVYIRLCTASGTGLHNNYKYWTELCPRPRAYVRPARRLDLPRLPAPALKSADQSMLISRSIEPCCLHFVVRCARSLRDGREPLRRTNPSLFSLFSPRASSFS